MKTLNPLYRAPLWAAIIVVMVIAVTSQPAQAQPEVSYLIPGDGWKPPPMGGPVVGYVVDQSTGKSYLVERDYFGHARIVDSILNEPDDPPGDK